MNTTIKAVFAITAFSILMPCTLIRGQDASTTAQPATKQSQPLQGSWEGVEVGQEAEGKCRITITGNSIHFQGANRDEWYKTIFTLPSGTDPKQLRATITDCSQPDYIGKVSLCIFKIEAGTLTLVGNRPGFPDAPKGFEGDGDSRTFVFHKAQPQKDNAGTPKTK
jgi:uncharacterized protein (TIGR03067 family)